MKLHQLKQSDIIKFKQSEGIQTGRIINLLGSNKFKVFIGSAPVGEREKIIDGKNIICKVETKEIGIEKEFKFEDTFYITELSYPASRPIFSWTGKTTYLREDGCEFHGILHDGGSISIKTNKMFPPDIKYRIRIEEIKDEN